MAGQTQSQLAIVTDGLNGDSMAGNGKGQGAILINGTALLAASAGYGISRAGKVAETTTPVTVTIGGVSAPVTFAGLAPGFAGLYQMNVQVPPGAPAGDAVAVALRMGTMVSNQVTVAVE